MLVWESLYENHPVARKVFEEVDDTLNQKLSKITFNGPEINSLLPKIHNQPNMSIGMALVRVIEYESKKKNL